MKHLDRKKRAWLDPETLYSFGYHKVMIIIIVWGISVTSSHMILILKCTFLTRTFLNLGSFNDMGMVPSRHCSVRGRRFSELESEMLAEYCWSLVNFYFRGTKASTE
ncbi:hypothetical protein AVEN_162423-1 [Araneus ventricosus]|uniref:Uncharacterized protein n=1 Tax=Araneus ventricosus TaxID=182803 RepID=A0A4Y2T1K6_ARAVE|nr:hypothetical protein AVEN_162423-1 [Araneus ventricosus]